MYSKKINAFQIERNLIIIIFLAHRYFIPKAIKTKQIGEISGMVTPRTRKLKMSWPGILS